MLLRRSVPLTLFGEVFLLHHVEHLFRDGDVFDAVSAHVDLHHFHELVRVLQLNIYIYIYTSGLCFRSCVCGILGDDEGGERSHDRDENNARLGKAPKGCLLMSINCMIP